VNALRAVLDAQSKNAHHEALRNARASVATPFLLDTVDFTHTSAGQEMPRNAKIACNAILHSLQ